MPRRDGSVLPSLISGLAGATALTLVHQAARYTVPNAPRMDIVGRRALAWSIKGLGGDPPAGNKLQAGALIGDVVLNSLYYSLVGLGGARHPVARGSALGTAAGIGAVMLPPLLKLGRRARGHTPEAKAMTVGWYLLGGLAAAAVFRAIKDMGGRRS